MTINLILSIHQSAIASSLSLRNHHPFERHGVLLKRRELPQVAAKHISTHRLPLDTQAKTYWLGHS